MGFAHGRRRRAANWGDRPSVAGSAQNRLLSQRHHDPADVGVVLPVGSVHGIWGAVAGWIDGAGGSGDRPQSRHLPTSLVELHPVIVCIAVVGVPNFQISIRHNIVAN